MEDFLAANAIAPAATNRSMAAIITAMRAPAMKALF
jgi:hypothetical protein